MITSKKMSLEQMISNDTISPSLLTYFSERTMNRVHSFILKCYLEEQTKNGLNKAKLAKKLGKKPEQITRWLETPSNLTLSTLSTLLVGMGRELSPECEMITNKPISNRGHELKYISVDKKAPIKRFNQISSSSPSTSNIYFSTSPQTRIAAHVS